MTQLTDRAERQTIQVLPDAKANPFGSTGSDFWYAEPISRTGYLSRWGTRARERKLLAWYRDESNTLVQGAFAGLTKKVVATPWELSGGRNLTKRFQGVFRDAQFGEGWGRFISPVILDYLRFDGGTYIEVIAPGNPLRPPTGAVTGLAHLDSLYCVPTGDPEFPIVYTDRLGKLHLMHRSRVLHLVDMPDGDQNHPGYGLSALSRAIAVVIRQLLMGRYVITSLDDKPPPGMLLVSGMTDGAWRAAWAKYRNDQSSDELPDWGRVIPLFGADASLTPKVESVAFSATPEKFDYKVYTEIDIDALALAIGVDRQEIAQLSGGNIGSAAQSQVLHAKSQGKAYGEILASLERAFNDVLPESLEFAFKTSDAYESSEQATNAATWAGFTAAAGDTLTPDEKRQILANQVEAVADAILDEDGTLIRLPDTDPKGEGQDGDAGDAPAQTSQPAANAGDTTAQDDTPLASKGLQTEEQRRWFFAHLNAGGTPSEPLVMDYEQFALRHGAGRGDLGDVALHRSSSNVSGSARRAQLQRQNELDDKWLEQRDQLRAEYDAHVTAGRIRPPTREEALILTARGHDDNPSVQAARRLLDKRGISWKSDDSGDKALDNLDPAFEREYKALLKQVQDGDVTEAQFVALLRALVNKYGEKAYFAALRDIGLRRPANDRDKAALLALLAGSTTYIAHLAAKLYGGTEAERATEIGDALNRAELWWNKSVQPYADEAVYINAPDTVLAFVGEDGEESCATCKGLKGVKRPMWWWKQERLRPRVDTESYICKGFRCQHRLQPV